MKKLFFIVAAGLFSMSAFAAEDDAALLGVASEATAVDYSLYRYTVLGNERLQGSFALTEDNFLSGGSYVRPMGDVREAYLSIDHAGTKIGVKQDVGSDSIPFVGDAFDSGMFEVSLGLTTNQDPVLTVYGAVTKSLEEFYFFSKVGAILGESSLESDDFTLHGIGGVGIEVDDRQALTVSMGGNLSEDIFGLSTGVDYTLKNNGLVYMVGADLALTNDASHAIRFSVIRPFN